MPVLIQNQCCSVRCSGEFETNYSCQKLLLIQNMNQYGHFGIKWNPLKPRSIKFFIELPITSFSIEENIFVLRGRFNISFANLTNLSAWVPSGEITVEKSGVSSGEESFREIVNLIFKMAHDRRDKSTIFERDGKKMIRQTLTVMIS